MVNNILNIGGTGSFAELPDVPRKCLSVTLQARTSAAIQYYYKGDAVNFWTIKADTSRTIIGEFVQGDLFVQAAIGVTIEVEYSVIGYAV